MFVVNVESCFLSREMNFLKRLFLKLTQIFHLQNVRSLLILTPTNPFVESKQPKNAPIFSKRLEMSLLLLE